MKENQIQLLSIAILGEMFRSNAYDGMIPQEMSIAAVNFANFIIESVKLICNGK
jgi:hypothetical protein